VNEIAHKNPATLLNSNEKEHFSYILELSASFKRVTHAIVRTLTQNCGKNCSNTQNARYAERKCKEIADR
jgi:hypothetical protein